MLGKFIGKKITYFPLTEQQQNISFLKGMYQTLALGNDFWGFMFSNLEDMQYVLNQGPWKIFLTFFADD